MDDPPDDRGQPLKNILPSLLALLQPRLSLFPINRTTMSCSEDEINIKKRSKGFHTTSFNITRLGLVRGVPSDWSSEEILGCIVVPEGYRQVLKSRRLNLRRWWTAPLSGNRFKLLCLPLMDRCCRIRCFSFTTLCRSRYTYPYPTNQYYNCCRYGHTKAQCRSQPRCFKLCFLDESCTTTRTKCPVFTVWADLPLLANYPEMDRQAYIIKISVAEESISYSVASKKHSAIAVAVQWNSESVRRDKSDLIFPLQKYSPTVAAVSEAWLRPGSH
ncbi:hypothetical protein EVAR_10512_1 [Eumeta japonica]|uniref:CCHC-type domain-containing protein n=1 Tax=Eumeta variegata TaxID=151549 RepID=A0A4C1TKV9_EUMVA|nr:hypothetical protein EVAR_10512_1 [Eumeta japonica]